MYVFTLKWNAVIVHLSQCLHSASDCPTSIKSVTHEQGEWSVIALTVKAHTLYNLIYLAFYLKIYLDVYIIDYMCLKEIPYYFLSVFMLVITQLCNRSTIITIAGSFCIAILLRRYFLLKYRSLPLLYLCESIGTKCRVLEHHPIVFCKLLRCHYIRNGIVFHA